MCLRISQKSCQFISATWSRSLGRPIWLQYDDWAHAFEGFNCKNIGASEERYPEDLVSLWKWPDRLDGYIDPLPVDRFDP